LKVKVKSNAQVYLERIQMLDEIIPCKLIERQQWKDLAVSITAQMDGERVQASGAKSKMEQAVVACETVEGEILDSVNRLIAEKQKRVSLLERLDTPIHYKILHMKYVQYKEFVDIADELKMEYTNVTTTHGRALAQVQRLIERM
jgi:hypothetical protein